jgi:hypothetical protein
MLLFLKKKLIYGMSGPLKLGGSKIDIWDVRAGHIF